MNIDHLDKQTVDGTQLNLDALYQICPSCFTETKGEDGQLKHVVNFEKLRALLGDNAEDDAPEVYDFTWVGKRAAQREAMTPIRRTLRPCPEESVNWDTTKNLYIEGDNLEVLKLLQNSYMGKVKMIYIDPPYNTGNDFVYRDDFHRTQREEDEAAGVINEEGERMVKNTESNGKFHSDWCSMIYSRLMVARSLLTDDGVIFISIDENEVYNLRRICNEIFGEENLLTQFIWHNNKKGRQMDKYVKTSNEFVLMYSKNIFCIELLDKKIDVNISEYPYNDNISAYKKGYPLHNGTATFHIDNRPNLCYTIYYNPNNDDIVTIDEKTGSIGNWAIPISDRGKELMTFGYVRILPKRNSKYNTQRVWRWGQEKTNREKNDLFFIKENGDFYPYQKERVEDGGTKSVKYTNYIDIDTSQGRNSMNELFDNLIMFDFPKPVLLLCHLLRIIPNDKSIILDFFSGSATTAHATMQLNAEDGGNRKFIMVQLPELTNTDSEAYKAGYKNICEIGKERIRRAGKKIKEEHPEAKDLDIGFRVFKCDESNYKEVAFAPKDYNQAQLDLFVDNIKADRTDLDLLFDCMLRWGVTLDLPMTKTKVDGCTIHNVNEGGLVACFDGRVTENVIDAIAAMYPVKVVFRDSSFEEAAQKMNLFELFKQKCGWTEQEVRNNVKVI